MEKVQFQLEATLPELKDLYEKRLFSKNEIDQITKRRTAFETSLIRRQTRKDDFFKYAEYEINLELLRKARWKRLKYNINPPPPSASTYSLPRRTAYILKRATVKFPGDLAVWLAYVEFASREGMRKVVLKGLNSALHHHPLSPTLYLLLSYHHLHPNSPFPGSSIPSSSKLDLPAPRRGDDEDEDDEDDSTSSGFSLEGTASARTNFLLGLRMIPKSQDLWREYIKLELGWVEGLRRRWQVLGVNIGNDNRDEEGGGEATVDPDALTGGEGSFGPEGEDARKAILSGQLIQHAITSALEAIPDDIAFRSGLLDMLRVYPSALRTKCLEVVYDDLRRISEDLTVPKSTAAQAHFTIVTKELYDRRYTPEVKDEGGIVPQGADLVDAVGKIGKEIKSGLKHGKGGPEWAELAGQWLIAQISLAGDNDFLRRYLLSIMTSLTKTAYRPSPAILLAHLEALRAAGSDDTALLQSARSHAAQYPADPLLQRIRLTLERSSAEVDALQLRQAFKSAMKSVLVSGQDASAHVAARAIYGMYFDWEESQAVEGEAERKRLDGLYRQTIRDTLRQSAIPHLHDTVLTKYFDWQIRSQPAQLLSSLNQIARTYRPSQPFFREAFEAIAARSASPAKDLAQVYDLWRSASKTGETKVAATLHWAQWQLRHGSGAGAADAVDIMRRELRGDAAAADQLERGWAAALDQVERRGASSSSSSDESDEDVDMEDGSVEED